MTASSSPIINGDDEAASLTAGGHSIEVRSRRSPDKLTPNEDAALVKAIGNNALVLAVADGVGGSAAGREAAVLVVTELDTALSAPDVTPESLRGTILDALESSNRALLERNPRGATTVVIAEIVDRRLRSYHVGDSELIVMGQRGAIKGRIIPHSPTGFAVEAGLLDETEAVRHEHRHILFNVVGAPDMRVDISAPIRLAAFDTVLLATDGLFDNLYIDEIVNAVSSGPLKAAVDGLFQSAAARMNGGPERSPSKPDDLTVIACRARKKKNRRRRKENTDGR